MILIADSGSTKTDWVLINSENKKIRYNTSGLNPFFVNSIDVSAIIEKEFTEPYKNQIRNIYFYGAGCINKEKNSIIQSGLSEVFKNAEIEIQSDLLGAARALFKRSEGIAAILGTGCNSGMYNGETITSNIPPLGYILGDEGSGAYLGKKLITALLRNELSDKVTNAFKESFCLEKDQILESIYKKEYPNRFLAQFSKFIYNYKKEPEIAEIITKSFKDFIANFLLKYKKINDLETGFVGSVAHYFREELFQVLQKHNLNRITILHTPIEKLTEFHREI